MTGLVVAAAVVGLVGWLVYGYAKAYRTVDRILGEDNARRYGGEQ